MASNTYKNQKKKLKFSKKRVDKASKDIRQGCTGELRNESIKVIQNYRETHLYPLMLIRNLLSHPVRKVSKQAIIARRLKRLATIINKLERPTLDGKQANKIRLTRMQDIGGCRVILPKLRHLYKLKDSLESSRSVHQIIKTVDYLSNPKDSGYLGVHLVYSCFSGKEGDSDWKGSKIEVQLRTELQHAWATSLEIIDTLENLSLKTSISGHDNWRRFFYIAGRLVAHEEKAFSIPEDEISGYIAEFTELESQLEVRKALGKFGLAIKVMTYGDINKNRSIKNHKGMFLIIMKRSENITEAINLDVKLTPFEENESDDALKALEESELKDDVLVSVLVSATDVKNLEKAYPNYLGSTVQFTDFISSQVKVTEKEKIQARENVEFSSPENAPDVHERISFRKRFFGF
jgi:ppGpp synthetase/RelA/SpoT-type nucleotidyltranferase